MALASGQATQIPLQITFKGINQSQAVEAAIRQRATRLERFSHQITRCHVIVDMPHQHRHRGNHYAIRIDVTTAAGEVFITRDPSLDDSHRDFQAVLRDAFDAAARHLESDAQRNTSEVWRRDLNFSKGEYVKIVAPSGRRKSNAFFPWCEKLPLNPWPMR